MDNILTSAFANVTGLTLERRIIFQIILFVITVGYALVLTRTLPEKQTANTDDGGNDR